MSKQHLLPTQEILELHAKNPNEIQITVNSSCDTISDLNPELNAVIWQDQTFTENEVKKLLLSIRRNQVENNNNIEALKKEFPLLGIPVLVKEIDSAIEGTENSWGNIELKKAGYKDTYTATKVRYLQNAGAIIVGKTNNSELADALITNSDAHGPSINPHDKSRNTLGSSGGSASGVACGMVNFATGGDGGGSIRMPAAACGIFGFKPSRGRITHGPMVSESWSGLASSGAFTTNIKDIATIIDVMSKYDSGDTYSASPHETNFSENLEDEIPPLKIGIRTKTIANRYDVNPLFTTAVEKVGNFLESKGHVVEFSSPAMFDAEWILEKFETLIAVHTKHDLNYISKRLGRDFDANLLTKTVREFYEMSNNISLEDFLFAKEDLEFFARETSKWFDNFDILITPTIADFAPRSHDYLEDDAYIYSGNTFPGNIAGLPGLNIPVNSGDENSLPCGVQIYSKRDNDLLTLQLGHLLERDYSDIFVTDIRDITS